MPETPQPLFDLTGEIAVVMGGTGVLGGALASGLAAAGARVAVVGRNQKRGSECVDEIRQRKGIATFFEAHAMDPDSLADAHREIHQTFGPPTILINAVGGNDPKVIVSPERPFSSISVDDWKANFDLNLIGGVLLPCQEFGPAMTERGRGSVINIASVSAHLPLSRVVTYSAAKAAVINLTQFLAREWAPRNVRVNSITPGFFLADQNRRLLFDEDGSPTARAQSIITHTPMARFGKSEELIGAAIFLACGQASGFVTGIDLRVDGGFLAQTI